MHVPNLPRPLALSLALAGVLAVALPRPATAVDPNWDHYKVYIASPKFSATIPVVLGDQFATTPHTTQYLDFFANPVDKYLPDTGQDFPIHDGLTHYTWWRVSDAVFNATVLVDNQFGVQSLLVTRATYLLNPALKNTTGPLPLENHYKCYECSGNPVQRIVRLTDQFDQVLTTVMVPRFLCNPTRKTVPNQPPPNVYEIVDPTQHYVCYEIEPDPATFSASVSDQFTPAALQLGFSPGFMLCVPSDKTSVTGSLKDTWGALKMLYR